MKANASTPDLWFLIWDPTQPVATRPLAIRKDGTWYTYGWDLTKNITEVYGPSGFIRTSYTYSPYGTVTADGDVDQPIQWSSEMYDAELGLVYYNYRYYNPRDGRWTRRDLLDVRDNNNLYNFCNNSPSLIIDIIGNKTVNSGVPPVHNPSAWNDGGRYQHAKSLHPHTPPHRPSPRHGARQKGKQDTPHP